MTAIQRRRMAFPVFVLAWLMAGLLSACGATRFIVDPTAKVRLTATDDVNPDVRGRASPVVVRVMELADRAAFDSLDFDAVWSNAEVALSDQLLSSREQVLLPKQTVEYRVVLDRRARFIAVVAAFRAIDEARWKLVYAVDSDWLSRHWVIVSANSVTLQDKRDSDQRKGSDAEQ